MSLVSDESLRQLEMSKSTEEPKNVQGANLIEDEKMEIGGVKWAVYSYYAKSIGWFFSTGTFLLYLIYQVLCIHEYQFWLLFFLERARSAGYS